MRKSEGNKKVGLRKVSWCQAKIYHEILSPVTQD